MRRSYGKNGTADREKKKKNFPRPEFSFLFHGQIASAANQKPP
jgi:hypothetical protein